MPKAKKKLLPKDFDALIRAGDIDALKAVFDDCEINARGGYTKQTALAFYGCPQELATWLVAQGADIEASDTYGRTPLHSIAASWNGGVDTLLELGADVHAIDREGDTPLHKAARFANPGAIRALLEYGASADALNAAGLAPLAAGLRQCDNVIIPRMVAVAELLLPDAPPSDILAMQASVQRIGETFEFHRAGFNPDSVEEVSAALDRLYALFGAPPVSRRHMHDGRSPIIATASSWQDQHGELWAFLVPSKGAAATVQGEVIRISGRISDEVERNGAANWDGDYTKMARAFVSHLGAGSPLAAPDIEQASRLVADVRGRDGASAELCRLAVEWVRLNPVPIALSPPAYRR